jgi:hypothetical protein
MNGKTRFMKKGGGIVLGLLFLLIGMASCTYHENLKPEIPDEPSFATDVIPIFNQSCNMTGCHNTGGMAPDLTEDNAYVSLTAGGYVVAEDAASSTLYTAIDGGTMDAYASDLDRAIIERWIEQGAENN